MTTEQGLKVNNEQMVTCSLEQLQQFAILTWHSSNFSKTRKIILQQFGKTALHQ
jgi:hypothetical protein